MRPVARNKPIDHFSGRHGVFGAPPASLAGPFNDALQLSPHFPGAQALEQVAEGQLEDLCMLAPPGTLERRYALALGLRALANHGAFTVMAPKAKGGARLRKELESLGCVVDETVKAHHRICRCRRPAPIVGLEAAIAAGAPRVIEPLGYWSQPGVFSWDRIDPGTRLLADQLPALSGRGVDLGCGLGHLAKTVLSANGITHILLVDLDRRALELARLNVKDPRANFLWADAAQSDLGLADVDFVVANPPFHNDGFEDRRLGQQFIAQAARVLGSKGVLWMVANRHLPYEAVLAERFSRVQVRADQGGYKVFEAYK